MGYRKSAAISPILIAVLSMLDVVPHLYFTSAMSGSVKRIVLSNRFVSAAAIAAHNTSNETGEDRHAALFLQPS
jgi:hypothetical protein